MYLLNKTLQRIVPGFWITPATLFVLSTLVVNGGNYGYNLVLGRLLSPDLFAQVGLMVTLLLAASFLAMTFQIVAARFTVLGSTSTHAAFKAWFTRLSFKMGTLLALGLVLFSKPLAAFFHLNSAWSIVCFGLAMPLFFAMSVNRGVLQGKEKFVRLAASYQAEMWGRAAITFALLYLLNVSIDVKISLAILGSVALGYWAIAKPQGRPIQKAFVPNKKLVYAFLAITAGYEGAQMLINYADILLVKHYFNAHSAGLYTSVALIGRIIYFMTWMVVMVLVPKILRLKKTGGNYKQALLRYLFLISCFAGVLITGAYIFARPLVILLFGPAYLPVAPLLWQYGLATTLFALSNLLVYYFLMLDYRLPVYLATLFGVAQIGLFIVFHNSLAQVVQVQIVNMGLLLSLLLVYFKVKKA